MKIELEIPDEKLKLALINSLASEVRNVSLGRIVNDTINAHRPSIVGQVSLSLARVLESPSFQAEMDAVVKGAVLNAASQAAARVAGSIAAKKASQA